MLSVCKDTYQKDVLQGELQKVRKKSLRCKVCYVKFIYLLFIIICYVKFIEMLNVIWEHTM